ncbi:hypothetical protein P43SY_007890 [Pythium insidiosum]|uniref:Uncharacterized protein n=1 Tax=Pythium insidiosum TaxID=114742 RepID=A0AAD5LHQ0_PYTIN|nr:hypothetical protein P43SY_007890 [Pythium insidiosum]
MSARPRVNMALLLDEAFGSRLLRGCDEWHGVADVVRTSFLLMYRELQQHRRRLAALETAPPAVSGSAPQPIELLQQQAELTREELAIATRQVEELRRSAATGDREIVSLERQHEEFTVRVNAMSQATQRRLERLQRAIDRLQRRVDAASSSQHEYNRVFTASAEQLQRRVRALDGQSSELSHEVETSLRPRVQRLEAALVAGDD